MAGTGDGESSLLRCLDYPCTRHLRLRRLLAYHRRYTHEEDEKEDAFDELIFEVKDLVKLVKTGKWRVAASYIIGFVPSDSMSDEATLLLLFLQNLMSLNDFAEGVTIMACLLSDWFLSIYKEPMLAEYPCFATLAVDVLFLRSDHARDFLNCQLFRNKAAEMIEEMVYRTPELKDSLHFPRGPHNLCHVVPIRSTSFHRRRHVKTVCRKHSTDYAQFYLQMKRRFPNSTQVAGPEFSGSARIRGERQMVLLEKALQAGGRPVPEQGHTPECSPSEVYRGRLRDGQEVAVKRLKPRRRDAKDAFGTELAILAPLRHDHIVGLGRCAEAGERVVVAHFGQQEHACMSAGLAQCLIASISDYLVESLVYAWLETGVTNDLVVHIAFPCIQAGPTACSTSKGWAINCQPKENNTTGPQHAKVQSTREMRTDKGADKPRHTKPCAVCPRTDKPKLPDAAR
ncbi:hypothetical protein C2845_PM15G21120 [Panicum miliaceum]|uniref:C2H2-type domain-containing protein n=1 Tax=Panicum miliaceum TaxID=4540 RepID=A0A3L6QA74_PANMI|nr:hypothetical protein C2845_PM15G21120 [Panicum miliaceum]